MRCLRASLLVVAAERRNNRLFFETTAAREEFHQTRNAAAHIPLCALHMSRQMHYKLGFKFLFWFLYLFPRFEFFLFDLIVLCLVAVE